MKEVFPVYRLFDDLMNLAVDSDVKLREYKSYPYADVVEDEQKYVVYCEMPGVDKKDIKVSFENGLLKVEAEQQKRQTKENEKFLLSEIKRVNWSRTFKFGNNVGSDNIAAKYENGVLELTLMKKEKPTPSYVEVL